MPPPRTSINRTNREFVACSEDRDHIFGRDPGECMRPPISLVLLLFPMRRRELSRKQAEGPERERNMMIEHHTAQAKCSGPILLPGPKHSPPFMATASG